LLATVPFLRIVNCDVTQGHGHLKSFTHLDSSRSGRSGIADPWQ
jgi:hypothetical protein